MLWVWLQATPQPAHDVDEAIGFIIEDPVSIDLTSFTSLLGSEFNNIPPEAACSLDLFNNLKN